MIDMIRLLGEKNRQSFLHFGKGMAYETNRRAPFKGI